MAVITKVLGRIDDPENGGVARDPLWLTSEERASAHMVGRTEAGRTVRISLPRGTELQDGDILMREGDTAVVVCASPEPLYVISPDTAFGWGVAGYQLGNMHRPVRFTDDAMLTPADPMVADLLARLDIPYRARTMPFVGKRFGAFTGHHHHD